MAVDGFLLERVSVVRGELTVLRQVSTHFPGGRCSAVRGASGSGKTTLLRLLNRLIDPTAGRVLLDGVPLTELDVLVLRRRVGLVAQAPVLLTDAVLDEVRVGRPDLSEGRVTELLARVGLGEKFVTRPTSGLSGEGSVMPCPVAGRGTGGVVARRADLGAGRAICHGHCHAGARSRERRGHCGTRQSRPGSRWWRRRASI